MPVFKYVSLAWAACMLLASPGYAHGIYAFAWVEGNRLAVESYYAGDAKVIGAMVSMMGADKTELGSTVTDSSGQAFFDPPETAQPVTFVVDAGQGHRVECALDVDAVGRALLTRHTVANSSEDETVIPAGQGAESDLSLKQVVKKTAQAPGNDVQGGLQSIDQDVVRAILRSELQAELAPVQRALARMQNPGPNLRDIVGGLGWIMGLAGIGAWVHSKKR